MLTDRPRNIAVFGATSAIAQAYMHAEVAAQPQSSYFLVARDRSKLEVLAADLKARGAKTVKSYASELADTAKHSALFEAVRTEFPDCDTILFAYGSLSDQEECEANFDKFRRCFETNFLSQASLLNEYAREFAQRRSGTLAVISSVAGDRGRKSNFAYGSAKGALSIYLQGLRNKLHESGVQVLTIKPGFVDTPMTAHLPKGALFAKPEVVGQGIRRAIVRGADVAYLPWFWWGIMFIIRAIPEKLFKRLSI